jgi:diguanylate cyclase (GGDEF)-like protein/PAS domain S-box-containing protein
MTDFEAAHAKQHCFLLRPELWLRPRMKNGKFTAESSDPAVAMAATSRSSTRQNKVHSARARQRQFSGNPISRRHDLAHKVFEFSHEGILITDDQNNILSVNRAFTEITGYSANEMVGQKPHILFHCGEDAAAFANLQKNIITAGYWQGEIWGKRKNGEIIPEWLTISTATDKSGKITHYIILFSDITEQKREASRMEYLAHHDALTGLPNRVLFNERLSAAISLAHRHGNALGILYIDLDGFKRINDTLGHRNGDHLLQQVSGRLTQCVRESDAVARLGGDEFVVLLNELTSQRSAEEVAVKIHRLLRTPFYLSAHKAHISASIGIALFPDHGTDNSVLLEKADAAMYKAKFTRHLDPRISLPPP